MKVADLLESRRQNWRELEQACSELEGFRIKRGMRAAKLVRFTSLYRAACADLALADSYQLPQYTVSYLQIECRSLPSARHMDQLHVGRWFALPSASLAAC